MFLALSSASFLNACAAPQALVASPPPPPVRPCEVPYAEPAQPLPAQADLSTPLDGPGWAQLEASDAGVYNALFPKFNANLDWAGQHCVAKASDTPPSK